MTEPTFRESIDEMLWRERTPAELIDELGRTYSEALPLRIHILIYQAVKLMTEQGDHDREVMTATARAITEKVRLNCTPSSEAYERGGDFLIREVADWIDNPPEWVKAPWVVTDSAVSEAGGDRG